VSEKCVDTPNDKYFSGRTVDLGGLRSIHSWKRKHHVSRNIEKPGFGR
jgi:hypothetical protein